MKGKTSGFTLIELLIVVAIIGILAAIAIPNFLLAQTRAKVARAKADLQASNNALEQYLVDNNDYPPMSDTTSDSTPTAWDNEHARLPNYLTTPISYTKKLFMDPFIPQENILPPFGDRYTYFNFNQYNRWFNPSWAIWTRERDAGKWLIYCWGPDKKMMGPVSTTVYLNYDPTNGVVTEGNIFRTQRNPKGYYAP